MSKYVRTACIYNTYSTHICTCTSCTYTVLVCMDSLYAVLYFLFVSTSPCIVDSSANIKVAGKRIAWGKYTNAGQSCLAPNYILCHQSIRDDLVASITAAVRQFYGEVNLLT